MPRSSALVIGWLLSLGLVAPALAQGIDQTVPSTRSEGVLQPGDVIRISVWPEATLGGEFPVEETGIVYLPVLGEVNVTGMTTSVLRAELRQRYRALYREAVVSVTPLYNVGVMGQVRSPGIYLITPTDGLFDVINRAGGFTPAANEERIRVVREGEVIQINALRALRSGQGLDPLELRSGDQIIVDERGGIGWSQMRDILAFFQSISLIITVVERFR